MDSQGELCLNGVTFELDKSKNTKFYIFESDEQEGMITIGLIGINEHETGVPNIELLIGHSFRVKS